MDKDKPGNMTNQNNPPLHSDDDFESFEVKPKAPATPAQTNDNQQLSPPPLTDPNALQDQVQNFRDEAAKKKDDLANLDNTNKDAAHLLEEGAQASDEKSAMNLGEKLVSGGIITNDQLEIALKEQRESDGKDLGVILTELNFITLEQLSATLSETSGVQSLDLHSMALDAELIRKIPKNTAIEQKIIAIGMEGDELHVATSDIYNVVAIDQIKKHFPKNVKITPYFANDFQISEIIDQYYDYEMSVDGILKEMETGEVDLTGEEEGYVNPTVRLVDAILFDAIKKEASDIHFEPEQEFVRLRYRIDGRLIEILNFHKDFWSAVSVRLKIMSGMNIAETRNPQDGRITYTIMGRKVDLRVASQPTVHGENVVARILDKSKSLVELPKLGLSKHNEKLLKRLLKRPEGVIIVTGPTGSGKTTTLYSVLSYINAIDINIMTLEDPVEYQLPIIRQSAVKEGTDMTFDKGIRSLMRQDPDIIFIGEIRDYDTAAMTTRAAMTGHQVFSTLHTNDAIGAIPRLVDIGLKGPLLAGTIICSIAQRLARRLCKFCKEEHTPSADECKVLGIDATNPPKLFKHKGCPKCMNTGYKGRIALYEILAVDKDFDDLISKEASRKEMLEYALQHGFVPMADDGIQKVLDGVTDLEELVHTVDMTERMKDVTLFI